MMNLIIHTVYFGVPADGIFYTKRNEYFRSPYVSNDITAFCVYQGGVVSNFESSNYVYWNSCGINSPYYDVYAYFVHPNSDVSHGYYSNDPVRWDSCG